MADGAGMQQGSPAIGAAGSAPAGPGAGGTEGSGAAGGSARIAVKKAQLRSSPRPKKLEKLAVYSSCKVRCVRGRSDLGLLLDKHSPRGSAALVCKMQAKQRKPLQPPPPPPSPPLPLYFSRVNIYLISRQTRPSGCAVCGLSPSTGANTLRD